MYDKARFFKEYFSRASEKSLALAALSRKLSGRKIASWLDLGCHDGELTLRALDALDLRAGGRIVCVDPSAAALKAFEERPRPARLRFEFHPATAEDFLASNRDRFDFVFASHSLYWTRDLAAALAHIAAAAECGLIVLRGARGIREIQARFRRLLGNPRERLYQAGDIERLLLLGGIPFRREDHRTSVLLPAPGSREFRWLAGFFLQIDDGALREKDLREVAAFLAPYGAAMPHDVSFFWLGAVE